MSCENKRTCACTYDGCPRHGKCCACIEYHRKHGELPGCVFTKQGEALWDRSIEAFFKDQGYQK